MNRWYLYDELIAGIATDETVREYSVGPSWTYVRTESSIGLAMTQDRPTRPGVCEKSDLVGMPLGEAAELVKSWHSREAAFGMAAINAFYNSPAQSQEIAVGSRVETVADVDSFELYRPELAGKKVAVIGRFPGIEERLDNCELAVIERRPRRGDYPDSACEYLLPEADYVFATGSTFVNRTATRLLELGRNAKFVFVGPSTPLASCLFGHGVFGLCGFVSTDPKSTQLSMRGVGAAKRFGEATMINLRRKK
ncbi:DUF364 domain-containing protein [Propionimicrobium lymphophilum]|uniref:Heavy-metal chelation domain-containing protein n=1 Tax=Propionimicrobium lymphophilum ACS-093-V-SCH5 TaxID=883161 RepID=S2VYA4_9ACTN|nr:DUF364 domain-containing protein [Propionimicrobium lymphophilum]EPD32513.1 hypothetical protein HMPREF9306_02085 [Propionimicrobium lymphophilum ACS-093-V-SCH5]MDK7710492.1 DUF364 domain-containing protein [Propionimicrobium lymphophilum]MDK7734486.1 DUF364 domain-containing protein [Propionimicrobium lymphophilum]